MDALHRALFLDRDGVVNEDLGYVHRIQDFHLTPDIVPLCRAFHEQGFEIVLITNQSGISRGYFSEKDFREGNDFLLKTFSDKGILITDTYFCVSQDDDHPDRKPNPGLFLRAQREHSIDMPRSIAVGDKETDITAAARAGVGTTILYCPRPYGSGTKARFVVSNLIEIVEIGKREGFLCS
jgi:D,D-heptose 1,7-bisphosphate phosphatase